MMPRHARAGAAVMAVLLPFSGLVADSGKGKTMPPSGPREGSNRLAGVTSPYLIQHKDNPVDWYPWGEEALAAARALDRPIFLSIGYSACHWCHVMEEESFENPATAALMNEYFINIKVDREERPDLDDIYMTAVQLLTGRGGWPMSVWLTPDLKPFYGGTYFPDAPRHGMPSFSQVLTRMGEAWRNDRARVEEQAGRVHDAVVEYMSGGRTPATEAPLDVSLIARAVDDLAARYDAVHGGFGPPPKFPPHRGLSLLLAQHRRTGDENLLRMATKTFDAMARGGMYDQVGGGFHRYSTDAQWLVPHFEKMLYDNALLTDAYLDAWEATRDPFYRRIVEECFTWLGREMTHPSGGFYSTLDADSEGEEGKFYVWRPSEVIGVIGREDGDLFNAFYGITERGNFEGGTSIPHITVPADAFARDRKIDPEALDRRLAAARAKLLAARAGRVRPHLDDKILSAWNGLMIASLARASKVLGKPDYLDAATKAARFLIGTMKGKDGLLRVSWRDGRLAAESFLDDQAFVLRALIALHAASGDADWLKEARALVESTEKAFGEPDGSGYYFTPPGREDLIVRARHPLDGAIPSGTSVMAGSFVDLYLATGEPAWQERAGRILLSHSGAMASMSGAFHNMLTGLDAWIRAGGAGGAAGAIVSLARPADPAARIPAGGRGKVPLKVTIKDGWHINPDRPTLEYLIPTKVALEADAGVTVEAVSFPASVRRSPGFAGREIALYEGSIAIEVTLAAAPGAAPGRAVIRGALTYQACSDTTCLRPAELPIAIPVQVVPAE